MTRTAFQLSSFDWVCEAYPCPTNAIFPQLELIQTLSREFERGPVSVSYTVRLTGVAQATGHTYNLGEAAQSMSQSKNGSQSSSAPQCKEGSRRKDIAAISLFLQPLEREVHMFLQQCNARCICAGEDTSIVPSEKVVGLAGYFWLQQLASLIPGNLAKRRVTSA